MAVIHVLDKHTAELIAAGEVVERPASVAKELLENSIDAGATHITLSILQGGIKELQIADDGSGIESEYIDKAFVRHATSKIEKEADLEHIHTLGFRGEALASIASVARVEVLTRTAQDEFACCYRICGGEPQGMEAGARPVGTTITVDDLFYNTPARMKFMKKDVSEGTFVAETVLHAALSHPEISFQFVRDGKVQFTTPGDGELKSAIYAALSRDFAKDLLPVDGSTGLYQVTGLVTPPRACRASRSAQYFYVNGRYVKNRTIIAAMEGAYKGTLMQGKFPGGVLMLTMPAELVDVNVHPAKTEIRFSREADVFDAVYHAVRTALAAPGSGECRFRMGEKAHDSASAAAAPPANPRGAAPASSATSTQPFATVSAEQYRKAAGLPPVASTAAVTSAQGGIVNGSVLMHQRTDYEATPEKKIPTALQTGSENDLDLLPDIPAKGKNTAEASPEQTFIAEPVLPAQEEAGAPEKTEQTQPHEGLSAVPTQQLAMEQEDTLPLRYVGEAFKTYIIVERGTELCLIDKHAAHERILFEKLAADYGDVASQMLLVPAQVNLSASEKDAVLQNLDLLQKAGIEAEDYGGSTVIVRGVPADVPVNDAGDMLLELASHLQNGAADAMREKTEWVLHSIACRAAIKAGDHSNQAELLELAKKIMDGVVPPFCPHGRPCVLKLSKRELEKQFGRIV